jgi:hypothetical protein
MEDTNSPPYMKSKRQVQQVIKLKFLALYNVLQLTYDCNKGWGCKSRGHSQRQFNKLYVIPCVKTLNCQYFKDIFMNVPLNEDLVVLEKQQYYIKFCHKICEECLKRLHLECSNNIACPMCEATQDINYLTHTQWIFNMSISRGFKIQYFQEFHDIYGGLQAFLTNNCGPSPSKRASKPSPFLVLQCTFVEKGYVESSILQKFGIKESMHVIICYSNISNKVNNKNNDLQPFWEHPNYMENWEGIYDDPGIIPTLTQGTLILNGYDIIKYNILNIEDLKFNMVLLMYLPNMWGDDYDYQRTLVDVNHYYETSPYEAKKNQQDPKRGRYKSVNHVRRPKN